MSETDLELLTRYSRHKAEDAFSEIVRRHLDLVYSAALRQVRSPQLAEEVAQSAFLKLARHADESERLNAATAEILRLRNEVTRLSGNQGSPPKAASVPSLPGTRWGSSSQERMRRFSRRSATASRAGPRTVG